ncbi:hypothetical protein CC80DRAFT_588612 [Byssothecium circinans]|uniref:Uncharacterized protein n=1 Tax=Byssothecium circinans TaxID=147558 RepID=A0A6A5UE01_9PLEO|nr:hypothetical protein CC80DRAFT_588612 [Byssothecium circinans]
MDPKKPLRTGSDPDSPPVSRQRMRLQKAPPTRTHRLHTTNNPTQTSKELHHGRHKTLQTIGELSAQNHPSPNDWRNFSVRHSSNSVPANTTTGTSSEGKGAKNFQRRSLPNQGNNIPNYQQIFQPLIVLNPEDIPASALGRSIDDASEGNPTRVQRSTSSGSLYGNPKRRSLNSSLRSRRQSSPLSTVTEGEQIETPPARPRSCSNCNGNVTHTQYINGIGSGIRKEGSGPVRPSDGWNMRRDAEIIKREQSSARLRRESDRNGKGMGIVMGSHPTLPSASTRPAAVRRHSSPPAMHIPRHLQPNHADTTGRSYESIDRRVTLAHMGAMKGKGSRSERIPGVSRRASAGGSPATGPERNTVTHRNSFHQTVIDPSWASTQLHTDLQRPPLVQGPPSRYHLARSVSSPSAIQHYNQQQQQQYATTHAPINPRKPNNAQHFPSPNPTHTPSMPPNAFRTVNRQSSNYPARTTPTPTTITTSSNRLETFPTLRNPSSSSPSHTPTPTPTPSTSSTATTSTSTSAPSTAPTTPTPDPEIILRENPDKRAATPLEREKLALWRAEQDARLARERVKERVRRANVLEGERERELEMEMVRREKEKGEEGVGKDGGLGKEGRKGGKGLGRRLFCGMVG